MSTADSSTATFSMMTIIDLSQDPSDYASIQLKNEELEEDLNYDEDHDRNEAITDTSQIDVDDELTPISPINNKISKTIHSSMQLFLYV